MCVPVWEVEKSLQKNVSGIQGAACEEIDCSKEMSKQSFLSTRAPYNVGVACLTTSQALVTLVTAISKVRKSENTCAKARYKNRFGT